MEKSNKNSLAALERKIRFTFKKKKLLEIALTHPSACSETFQLKGNAYERMEFFGDSIINFLICEKLFAQFPNANEGVLSRYRSTLVSRKIMSAIAKKISLHNFLRIANENEFFFRAHPKLLTDTFEALVGAMYLDRGISQVRLFVNRMWKPFLNRRKILTMDPNPKSTLQEISQKHFKQLPIYEIKSSKNGFEAFVRVQKRTKGKGFGISKQEAAEKAALELIGKLKKKGITL